MYTWFGHTTFLVKENWRPPTTSKSGYHSIYCWLSTSLFTKFITTMSKRKRTKKRRKVKKRRNKRNWKWRRRSLPLILLHCLEQYNSLRILMEEMDQLPSVLNRLRKRWVFLCSQSLPRRSQLFSKVSITVQSEKSNGSNSQVIPMPWALLFTWRKSSWVWTSLKLKDLMSLWIQSLCN